MKTKLIVTMLALFVISCKSENKESIGGESKENQNEVINVVTTLMDFQTKDTIPSGWNTFKYMNRSQEVHFFLLDKYPEGKTLEDTNREIVPPFDKGMELIIEGKNDKAMAAFGELPEWFSEIVFTGGSGMISPGQTNTVMIKLEPGLYIMECYVKMMNGKFHTSMGMTKEIWVTDEDSGISPPIVNAKISISSTEGINYKGTISKGTQTFKVDYLDQIVHENFVGHDINLIKIEEGADLDALEAWMNWATPTGLMTPAPQHITFLGGTNDAPAGTAQYFTVNLEPGNYAFISEVPNPSEKGMFKQFKVSE